MTFAMAASDLDKLRSVMARHPEAAEPLGLFLAPTFKPSGYASTPECCRTFGWTGGDGVHFSIAEIEVTDSPIVITVPMNFDAPNMVVGNSLREFLALGMTVGYFSLEKLVYEFEAGLTRIAEGFEFQGPARSAIEDIRETFALELWNDARNRLAFLNAKYAKALR